MQEGAGCLGTMLTPVLVLISDEQKPSALRTTDLGFPACSPLSAAAAAAAAVSLQSCPTLCDPMDGSPPGSPVPGILKARTLQLPFPTPGDLPDPGIEPMSLVSPTLAGGFFTTVPPGKPCIDFGDDQIKSKAGNSL